MQKDQEKGMSENIPNPSMGYFDGENWLHHEIRQVLEPEAKELLATMPDFQRNMRTARVAQIRALISARRWLYQGDPIRLSKTGQLLDGQHRLKAMLDLREFPDVLVISGFENEIYDSLDTGVKRSLGDVFKAHGIAEPSRRSVTCMHLSHYLRGMQQSGNSPVDRTEIVHCYLEYEEVILFWSEISKQFNDFYGRAPIFAAAFAAADILGHSRETLLRFVDEFRDRMGTSNLPAFARQIARDNQRTRPRYTQRDRGRMLVKAIALSLEGVNVSSIQFRDTQFYPIPLIEECH